MKTYYTGLLRIALMMAMLFMLFSAAANYPVECTAFIRYGMAFVSIGYMVIILLLLWEERRVRK